MSKYFDYQPVFDKNPIFILDKIISKAQKYLPAEQIPLISKAYYFAHKAHLPDKRLSWEPYIIHPLRTTEFLMEIKPDIVSIQAALLHDVVEDTPITLQEIHNHFDEEVAFLCDGLEKVSKIKYRWEERQIETLKKTFIAMAKDLRVIFIKLADRIHNIQTLHYHPKIEKRKKIATETMEIYVSIAKKLWLYHYQLYLENGSFKILHEKEFSEIFQHLKKTFWLEKSQKDKWIKAITAILKKEKIKNFKVKGRLKSPRRIYKKMKHKYKTSDISKIMDLLAYRIITTSVSDCYMVLWVIHKYYTPLIKKIKDYVAVPKFNWYKSIHTTILGIFRFPTEIQIRTYDMDEIAKYWVAAHFEYSEKWESIVPHAQSMRIKKIQQLVEAYKSSSEKEAFKNKLNVEALEKSSFIYTPQGDVIELPQQWTVLDFAFRIHSNIGLRYKNALVNWEIKPISYILNSGDIVEIKTFKTKISANKHRTEFLHTPSAKSQLNRFLKKQQKNEIIKQKTTELNLKLKEFNLPPYSLNNQEFKKEYTKNELEKTLLEVSNKKTTFSKIIQKVYPNQRKDHMSTINKTKQKTKINKKLPKVLVDLDKQINYTFCAECSPTRWDKIIAKTGKDGIKIHKISCKAMKTISFQRLLEAHRQNHKIKKYNLLLTLQTTWQHKNILSIITLFSALNIDISQISIEENNKKNKISLQLQFYNPTKVSFLLDDLKKHKDSIKILKKKFIF